MVTSSAVITTKEEFRSQILQRKEASSSLSSSRMCRKNPSLVNICNRIMDLCQTLIVEPEMEGYTIKGIMTKTR